MFSTMGQVPFSYVFYSKFQPLKTPSKSLVSPGGFKRITWSFLTDFLKKPWGIAHFPRWITGLLISQEKFFKSPSGFLLLSRRGKYKKPLGFLGVGKWDMFHCGKSYVSPGSFQEGFF